MNLNTIDSHFQCISKILWMHFILILFVCSLFLHFLQNHEANRAGNAQEQYKFLGNNPDTVRISYLSSQTLCARRWIRSALKWNEIGAVHLFRWGLSCKTNISCISEEAAPWSRIAWITFRARTYIGDKLLLKYARRKSHSYFSENAAQGYISIWLSNKSQCQPTLVSIWTEC